MIYKAQSPASFAEEYIVDSIWKGHFAPGTILPPERELSELIGVTRTTLREVLQRLARDGWLTIQHGKPTKVNNFWETSGLNILETIARLDAEGSRDLIDNLLSARTNVSAIYLRSAIRNNPDKCIETLSKVADLYDDADSYAEFDYQLNHQLAFASGNTIYVLMLNGFKGLYSRIGSYFFSDKAARKAAKDFYNRLLVVAETAKYDDVPLLVKGYGVECAKIWADIREKMPSELID